jgi:hypothetical protein
MFGISHFFAGRFFRVGRRQENVFERTKPSVTGKTRKAPEKFTEFA